MGTSQRCGDASNSGRVGIELGENTGYDKGLDLWHATIAKHGSKHSTVVNGVLWHDTDMLYETIDAIQAGDAPWKNYKFSYSGPKPTTPPHWMEEMYELNAHVRGQLTVS